MTVVARGDAGPAQGEDPSCAICLEDLWDRRIVQLDCAHRFHAVYMEDWLKAATHPLFALCRAPVEPAPASG